MFSRNKSNQCFNIESVSRKKIVNVQRDNDIFNRYASLSRKGVVFPKEDFSFKPDKSLKNEMVSMIYDNSNHSRNTNAQSVKKENSCDIIFYDRTHNYFYKKNNEFPTDNKNKKVLNKSCEISIKEAKQKTQLKQNRYKNKRSSSIIINDEIAQFAQLQAVLQGLAGIVGVHMYLDQRQIAHDQHAIADAIEMAAEGGDIAGLGIHAQMLNPELKSMQQELLDKHFLRKHGANAYYGQN